jgi:uncharacterized protein YdcH (DUF465 family)
MSEIVTREEFDQFLKIKRKIVNKIAEIASRFKDYSNLREKKITKDISGLNFDFEAPPSYDWPDNRYIGIYKPDWLTSDSFGIYTRDDDECGRDILRCYDLPVSMLTMTGDQIEAEAEKLNKKIEDRRAAARKAVEDTALKNMYKSYLKLKDIFEKMPQSRIDEITGENHEQAGN